MGASKWPIVESFKSQPADALTPSAHSMTHIYHIPSSEILDFPSVINFDIITSDDINFHFQFLP